MVPRKTKIKKCVFVPYMQIRKYSKEKRESKCDKMLIGEARWKIQGQLVFTELFLQIFCKLQNVFKSWEENKSIMKH